MGLDHDTAVGGEDEWVTMPDGSEICYAICELDEGQLGAGGGSTAYVALDEGVPAIPRHLNPGAYLQNVKCVDPVSIDVDADDGLCTKSGTAGKFKSVIEAVLQAGSGSDGEEFQAGAVIPTNAAAGTFMYPRIPLRQAYFLADPSLPYGTVAYIVAGGL